MKLDKLSFAKNDILFGHDNRPGIVAMELEGDGAIRVYRKEGARLLSEIQPFHPFLLLSDTSLLGGIKCPPEVTKLEGSGDYRYRAIFTSWAEMDRTRRTMSKRS